MNHVFLAAVLSSLLISCNVQEKYPQKSAEEIEAAEFNTLMVQDSKDKQETAAESLDLLLNGNAMDNRVSMLINNNTDCNIILRFTGDNSYNLPIRKHFRNFIVMEKGNYSLGANLCRARYASSKTISESMELTISERE